MFSHFQMYWNQIARFLSVILDAAWHLVKNLAVGLEGVWDRAFADFYTAIGPEFAKFEQSSTPVPRLVGSATGVVLELGPGPGMQLSRFNLPAIERIYGVEPNAYFLPALAKKTAGIEGMSGKYIPIIASLDDEAVLAAHGISNGSIDTVVCMQVLCSVRDPVQTVKRIFELLKPGGHFVFWEHEASEDNTTRRMQYLVNILWSPLVGGCRLNADVSGAIMGAGPWQIAEFEKSQSTPSDLMPRVCGRLVKPGGLASGFPE